MGLQTIAMVDPITTSEGNPSVADVAAGGRSGGVLISVVSMRVVGAAAAKVLSAGEALRPAVAAESMRHEF
jgi:hypothetical protein